MKKVIGHVLVNRKGSFFRDWGRLGEVLYTGDLKDAMVSDDLPLMKRMRDEINKSIKTGALFDVHKISLESVK